MLIIGIYINVARDTVSRFMYPLHEEIRFAQDLVVDIEHQQGR